MGDEKMKPGSPAFSAAPDSVAPITPTPVSTRHTLQGVAASPVRLIEEASKAPSSRPPSGIVPHGSGQPVRNRSSFPPPLPASALAPVTTAGALLDEPDDGTPVPITLPSSSLDPNELRYGMPRARESAPVLVMSPPAGDVAPTPTAPSFAPLAADALAAGLPAELAPGPFGAGSSGPISAPASSGKVPVSFAPPMPQIPKQVAAKPMVQAPGIVSTQAIPLMTAASKRKGYSPLLVAALMAFVGGAIALVALLVLQSKPPAEASAAPPNGPEAPAQTAAASAPAATAANAPAAASASAASTSAPTASPADVAPAKNAAAPATDASGAAPVSPRPTSKQATAPAAPTSRQPRKSDRIED